MLTVDEIIRAYKRRYPTPGSYTLPLMPHHYVGSGKVYSLTFNRGGKMVRIDFRKANNGLAVLRAMRLLNIRGKLTRAKLRRASPGQKVSLQSVDGTEVLWRYQ
jgi:hypothetical protein